MTTAFNDIRAALESEIANVSGIPAAARRAWENVDFDPGGHGDGMWVRMTLIPGEVRPAVAGPSPQLRYSGLFQVDVFAPEGDGPFTADELADNIRASFGVGDNFTSGGTSVRIAYSERRQGVSDPPWYQVSVVISWYSYRQ